MKRGRVFAVIPAAGQSRRMGRPKLILPVGGQTVIRRLLHALEDARIEERVVVTRRDDQFLADEVSASGATLVQPVPDPPDMRSSVEHAVAWLRSNHAPINEDRVLLVPADHPVLASAVIADVLHQCLSVDAIVIPTYQGRRGHPTVFPWSVINELNDIPADNGLNWLVHRDPNRVCELAVDDAAILTDLDTPDDYRAMLDRVAEEGDD